MKCLFKEGKKFDLSNPEVLNFLYENLNTFKEFEKDYDIKPIWGEKSFSLDKFGGTVDLYCELNNKYTILDFKTSKRFYSSHFIQLGAYIQLLEANDYKVEQVAILRIKEGDYDIKIINREDMNDYIELFNRLVEVFYLVYELNEEWGDLL